MVIGFGLYAVVVSVLDPATMETGDPGVGLGELGVAGFELPPQAANPNNEIKIATRKNAERIDTSVGLLHRKRAAVDKLQILCEISQPGQRPTYVSPGRLRST
jgi:hypothetical protein